MAIVTSRFLRSNGAVNLAVLLVCGPHSEMSASFDVGVIRLKYGVTKSVPISFDGCQRANACMSRN